jgi:iron complex outermembrane recepter protein
MGRSMQPSEAPPSHGHDAKTLTKPLVIALIAIALWAAGHTAIAADSAPRTFQIEAQSVSAALKQFAAQSDLQLIFTEADVGGAKTSGVAGTKTARQALTELLKGTGLEFAFTTNNVVVVRKASGAAAVAPENRDPPDKPTGDPPKEGKSDFSQNLREAQVDQGHDGPEAGRAEAKKKDEALTEVVVTGTRLKDVTDTASPVMVFTRAEIDQSGLGSVGAFLQKLPQNFSNVSETTIASVTGGLSSDNAVNATGVNLRGLGSDATLVLVDGHRVAPGGSDGNIVDVSMIPLSAVERIEVLTDGASAVYGSDAVGGVVNIIMRHDFDGLETRARVGRVSDGSSHETQLGQSAGKNWGSGSALLSYEFYDRTPLSAADRPYTVSAPLPFTLLPEQIRQSAFASLNQSLGSDLSLFADGLYSHRWTYIDGSVVGAFSQYSPATIDEYSATVGGRWRVSDTTELEMNGGFSRSDSSLASYDIGTVPPVDSSTTRTTLSTGEAVLRGSLGTIPGGALQYAAGGQFRRESYDSIDYVAESEFQPHREVAAGFVEVRVPLIGASMALPAVQRLELTLADRQEHYSDFGSTNDPTFGLIWQPMTDFKVRGTYGRSFVAPLLSELNPVPFEVVAFNTSLVPGSAPPSGDVNELVVFGGNPELRAQTAKTWTIGADWDSATTNGWKAHLNYYAIEFTDRITNLQAAGYNVFYALPMAAALGPQIVRTNPSAALVQQLVSSPGFVNFGATNLTNFAAVIDSRELNLSSVDTRGLDSAVSYHAAIGPLEVDPGLDLTYIWKLTNQFTTATPETSVVNTLYNPTRVKARGHLMLSEGPVSLATFVNYVNSYTNNVTAGQPVPISSWTTIDLTASYACTSCSGLLRDFAVSAGVINLANRAPPYAANANGYDINYDGANANPLGRYLFVQLSKHW